MKEFDRTYVQIDLDAIRSNIINERKLLAEGTKLMAVVKANAYGHGACAVSKCLYDLVDGYGVAMMEEALELRQCGIDKMILILGYTPDSWFPELLKQDISQTIYNYERADRLNRAAVKGGKRARIHIKLDTGMGRIGFFPNGESVEAVKKIAGMPGLKLEGIFTHFARADEASIDPAREPLRKFLSFVEELEKEGVHIPIRHAANSAAIMGFPEAHLDMVRSGITTYGLYPSEEVNKEALALRPALSWRAKVSYVKEVGPGTTVSYGGTFVADRPMRIATIPVGYADGMKRDLSGKGRVLLHGKSAAILGRVCMDQFMVDVTEIPETAIGDTATIIGRDGDEEITVEEIAGLSHSFNYEFVCSISERVHRNYKRE